MSNLETPETLLGWCMAAHGTRPDQHHNLCPGQITSQLGVTWLCSCPQHHRKEGND